MPILRRVLPLGLFAAVLPLGACNAHIEPTESLDPAATPVKHDEEHIGSTGAALSAAETDVNAQIADFKSTLRLAENGVQGFCVAMVSAKLFGGVSVQCGGKVRPSSYANPTGDTIFNIGSITKAFVAELFADEVLRGERCYTDKLYPRLVANGLDEVPQVAKDEKLDVELRHLATHTAGFSKNPNLQPTPSNFPTSELYIAYLDNEMACNPFLTPAAQGGGNANLNFTHCSPSNSRALAPGEAYSYSNMGISLLAEALSKPGLGNHWSNLMQFRFLMPLGMTRTGGIALTAEEKTKMAWANDDESAVGSWWGWWPGGAGGSGMHSTANDMLKWMKFHMGLTQLLASRYPNPHACGLPPAGPPFAGDPFGGTGPTDMAVNETWRKRVNEGLGSSPYDADPSFMGFGWNIEPYSSTLHPTYTIVDKGGDCGSQDNTLFHAKTAFAIKKDTGERSSAVTVLLVTGGGGNPAAAGKNLAKQILDSLETN